MTAPVTSHTPARLTGDLVTAVIRCAEASG